MTGCRLSLGFHPCLRRRGRASARCRGKPFGEELLPIPFQQQGARHPAWGVLGAAEGWSDICWAHGPGLALTREETSFPWGLPWLPPRSHQNSWPPPNPCWGRTVDPRLQKPQPKSPRPPPWPVHQNACTPGAGGGGGTAHSWATGLCKLCSRLGGVARGFACVVRVPLQLRAWEPLPL